MPAAGHDQFIWKHGGMANMRPSTLVRMTRRRTCQLLVCTFAISASVAARLPSKRCSNAAAAASFWAAAGGACSGSAAAGLDVSRCPKWPTRSAHPRLAAALDATTCAAQPSWRAGRASRRFLAKAEGAHRQDGAGRKRLHHGLQLCKAAVQRVGDLHFLLGQIPSLFTSLSDCARKPVLHANEAHLDEQQPSTVKVRSCQAATLTGAAGFTWLSCRRAGWRVWYGAGICRHECCLQNEVSRFTCLDAQKPNKQEQCSSPDGRITSVGR